MEMNSEKVTNFIGKLLEFTSKKLDNFERKTRKLLWVALQNVCLAKSLGTYAVDNTEFKIRNPEKNDMRN